MAAVEVEEDAEANVVDISKMLKFYYEEFNFLLFQIKLKEGFLMIKTYQPHLFSWKK